MKIIVNKQYRARGYVHYTISVRPISGGYVTGWVQFKYEGVPVGHVDTYISESNIVEVRAIQNLILLAMREMKGATIESGGWNASLKSNPLP